MREIKFRAWDCKRKEMLSSNCVNLVMFLDGELYDIDCNDNIYAVDDLMLMQYTGLKDKNGIEIYEGDILNCREYECFGKIEWNDEGAGFYFNIVLEGGGYEEDSLYDYLDEVEVIGNIYENPELLEVVE